MTDQPPTQIARVTKASEPWIEYELDDGTLLRGRLTWHDIRRQIGVFGPHGDPAYQFNQQIAMEVHAPVILRKPDGAKLALVKADVVELPCDVEVAAGDCA